MITVADYARSAGVSAQTVYRRLKYVKQVFDGCLTVKQGGITYITEEGVTALTGDVKQEFNDVKQSFNNVKHPVNDEEVMYLRVLSRNLQDELQREREHSRTQAERLASLAEQLAELTRNNQLLLGAEQSRTNPALQAAAEPPEVAPRSWWSRFIRRGKDDS